MIVSSADSSPSIQREALAALAALCSHDETKSSSTPPPAFNKNKQSSSSLTKQHQQDILSASISLTILAKSAPVADSKNNKDNKLMHNTTPSTTTATQNSGETPQKSGKHVVSSRITSTPWHPASMMPIHPSSTSITTIKRGPIVSGDVGHAAAASGMRFREYQVNTWTLRLQEVQEFVQEHGHCMIPSHYPPNQKLAKWAKRQRCQYQLFLSNPSKSSMTAERIEVLNTFGFCWQNKISVWQTRYQELLDFRKTFGHAQVPSEYKPNQRLATWVKCQRRQKRLRERGKPSSMTNDRIGLLEKVHFAWQLYPSTPRKVERSKHGL